MAPAGNPPATLSRDRYFRFRFRLVDNVLSSTQVYHCYHFYVINKSILQYTGIVWLNKMNHLSANIAHRVQLKLPRNDNCNFLETALYFMAKFSTIILEDCLH